MALLVGGGALAQDDAGPAITITLPADLSPEVRAEVIQDLQRAGAIAVDEPQAVQPLTPSLTAQLAEALREAFSKAYRIPPLLDAWWSDSGGIRTLLVTALALGLGLAAAQILRRRVYSAPAPDGLLPPFRERLGPGLKSFVRDVLGIALFAAVALLIGLLALSPTAPLAKVSFTLVFETVARALVLTSLVHLAFQPGHPEARLAPLTNREAHSVWPPLLFVIWAVVPVNILIGIVVHGAGQSTIAPPTVLIGLVAMVVPTLLTFWLFWTIRKPMAALIRHTFGTGREGTQPRLAGFFAANWHWLYMGFALITFTSGVLGILLPEGDGGGRDGRNSMVLLLLAPFIIGGIGAWFDGRDENDTGAGVTGSLRALAQGLAGLLLAVLIARAWGADPFNADGDLGDRISSAIFNSVFAVVIGWALWRGVQAAIDAYGPGSSDSGIEDESMGKTGSRIETLIPVLRSTALFVIVLISGMTALTSLGVNIAPLLAGAGVVGLAIGFGAQKIVSDVITGIFYLIEDAFRVGEYIVTDEGKGVVEKISLRSVRLRHHRGPVYTISFTALGTVQNHSRDWVKIKFMLRVPFDADLEVVRKAVKNVGIELMENPEYADQFLQPVKSQGVMQVDDSGIVIGVKFVCKPGEQFVLRREAYARIKKAFAEKDIQFAPRRVIVDSEEGSRSAHAGAAAAAAAHAGVAGREDGDVGMP